MSALKIFSDSPAVLGEGPLWDVKSQRLNWVDCDQKKIFTLDPASGAVTTKDVPHYPGSYAYRQNGGMIVAYRNMLVLLDDKGEVTKTIETGADFSKERFNDGACDRRGRFWVGTMDRKLKEPVGSLFRIDPDLSAHKLVDGLIASNGIAFRPDDKVMYHTDTGANQIYAYDYDIATGGISNKHVFADFKGGKGHPDGCTIDADGYLWVAMVAGARVVRLDPTGKVVRTIDLPALRPTSVMLGGPALKTLYITSMRFGLTPEQLALEPAAGCLMSIEVDVPGLPETRFAG